MRGGRGAGRVWGGGQGGRMEAFLSCGNIKTGTVKKKQSWLSSIEYGGNGAHAYLPLSKWYSFVSFPHAHTSTVLSAYISQALSSRMVELPGQNTKGTHGGSMRALNAEEYFLPCCLPPNIQNPSLFLRWHAGSSIQLRQANHCVQRENLSQGRRLTQTEVDNQDSGNVS